MSINKVMLTGNLTRDPELKSSITGTAILSFGIAVNERRKNNSTGEWEDIPNFVDCTMFGKRAEAVARFISKGSKVAIEGKLHYSSWERDGQRRSKLDVIVDEIEFLSRQEGVQQSTHRPAPRPQTTPVLRSAPQAAPAPQAQAEQVPLDAYYMDEDIPF